MKISTKDIIERAIMELREFVPLALNGTPSASVFTDLNDRKIGMFVLPHELVQPVFDAITAIMGEPEKEEKLVIDPEIN